MELEGVGIKVRIEKALKLNGIRTRQSFLENGRWNIIEIEYGCDRSNNIFKNFDSLSKLANIQIIDIKPKF